MSRSSLALNTVIMPKFQSRLADFHSVSCHRSGLHNVLKEAKVRYDYCRICQTWFEIW